MRTRTKILFLHILVITCAWTVDAQSERFDIRIIGEHRIAPGETAEIAETLALMTAKHKLLQEAGAQLKVRPEIKAVPLQENQIDALVSTIVETQTQQVHDDKALDSSVHRVGALAHLNPSLIALRLNQLRRDRNNTAELTEVWRQNEELYQELTQPAARAASIRQEDLFIRIAVNDLVARIYTALARTEESPASARVSSPKGKQRALHLAELAVTMSPDLPQARLAMGDALAESSEPVLAEAEYRKALTLTPSSTTGHIKLAEVLRAQGRLPEAIEELRQALRLDPASAIAHSDLGFVLGQQNDEGAISEYREAIKLDANLIEAHNNLAIALARQGMFPEAVAEFQEMVRIDPDSVLGYYNMAIALADMEKDAESAEALRQAVRVNPNHFNARFNLAELFRLEGKLDEAVKQFREYLRMAPDTPQNQRNIRRAREFVQSHENP